MGHGRLLDRSRAHPGAHEAALASWDVPAGDHSVAALHELRKKSKKDSKDAAHGEPLHQSMQPPAPLYLCVQGISDLPVREAGDSDDEFLMAAVALQRERLG